MCSFFSYLCPYLSQNQKGNIQSFFYSSPEAEGDDYPFNTVEIWGKLADEPNFSSITQLKHNSLD